MAAFTMTEQAWSLGPRPLVRLHFWVEIRPAPFCGRGFCSFIGLIGLTRASFVFVFLCFMCKNYSFLCFRFIDCQ